MERLRERLALAERALARFEEVLLIEKPSAVERDAAIKRFEFTFETVWKAAKDYLFVQEGLDLASPKAVIRSCREASLLDDEEASLALIMADDRNLTTHTYNEPLAAEIVSRFLAHKELMRKWLERMQQNLAANQEKA